MKELDIPTTMIIQKFWPELYDQVVEAKRLIEELDKDTKRKALINNTGQQQQQGGNMSGGMDMGMGGGMDFGGGGDMGGGGMDMGGGGADIANAPADSIPDAQLDALADATPAQ